jgi:uncharacterized protein (DUF2252 family)
MVEFAAMRSIDVWYARLDAPTLLARWEQGLSAAESARVGKRIAKGGAKKNSLRAFSKLTEEVDGKHRIVSDPPLIIPLRELDADRDPAEVVEWLQERFLSYRESLQHDRQHLLDGYRIIDVAHKVVGVGSVGTRCWIVLMFGRDETDPLFVQTKEATHSVLEPHCGPSDYPNHGQRVVEGQRLLQAASDVLLGWSRSPGLDGVERDFYMRQLWDGKISPDYVTMSSDAFGTYAEVCGWTLARGHARSGDRIAIGGYLGSSETFDNAIADFAAAYTDQNQRDYEATKEAVDSGRLAASAVGPGLAGS